MPLGIFPMASMDARNPRAQSALAEALSSWIDDPGCEQARNAVSRALDLGGRLELPAHPRAGESLLHACAATAFSRAHWEGLGCFFRASGSDIDALDDEAATPLSTAAGSGNLSAVEALLGWGSDPARRDAFGRLAVHRCCGREDPSDKSSYEACLRRLLAALPRSAFDRIEPGAQEGSDPEDPGCPGPAELHAGSPVHFACRSGFSQALRILSECGASLDEPEPLSGLRPLELCLSLAGISLDRSDAEQTSMALAALGCSVELDPRGFDERGSPLRQSLALGMPRLAMKLLERGASLDAPSQYGPDPAPLRHVPPGLAAQGEALGFWLGYMAMTEDERSLREALADQAGSERASARRGLRSSRNI